MGHAGRRSGEIAVLIPFQRKRSEDASYENTPTPASRQSSSDHRSEKKQIVCGACVPATRGFPRHEKYILGILRSIFKKKNIHSSSEIKYFVETHLRCRYVYVPIAPAFYFGEIT